MYDMAIAPIAYTRLAALSKHGSGKRFRELVTYCERTLISELSRVRKSYLYSLNATAVGRKIEPDTRMLLGTGKQSVLLTPGS
jgi:hypothetical protein